jgi:hypothetical protein
VPIRVELSRSRSAYHYRGKLLQKLVGFKNNCIDAETGEMYWASGPKKNGGDRLYGDIVEIDEDAREEYWLIFAAYLNASIGVLIAHDDAQQLIQPAPNKVGFHRQFGCRSIIFPGGLRRRWAASGFLLKINLVRIVVRYCENLNH